VLSYWQRVVVSVCTSVAAALAQHSSGSCSVTANSKLIDRLCTRVCTRTARQGLRVMQVQGDRKATDALSECTYYDREPNWCSAQLPSGSGLRNDETLTPNSMAAGSVSLACGQESQALLSPSGGCGLRHPGLARLPWQSASMVRKRFRDTWSLPVSTDAAVHSLSLCVTGFPARSGTAT